jgi:alanine-glyoxylate transaminase / serine-glyoxylate transaminase / serine-pyruvate transaminase
MAATSQHPRPRGRQFFFNPGPTNIPDRVLNAMNRPTLDFLAEDFLAIQRRAHAGVMRVMKTRQHVIMYAANGHGAWEAGFVNVFEPGSRLLVLESGRFSQSWSEMARALGFVVETLPADWRRGVQPDALKARLAADTKGEIKGVLAVHNETSTGMMFPLADYRAAIDAAGHAALYLVDTISSLGSFDFRMDDWGIDIAVGGSQKGLMMTTGLSFTGVSEKAMAHSKALGAAGRLPPRGYFDWRETLGLAPQRFPGTTPVHMVFGLDEAVRMLEDEGLEQVFARHARLAGAARAAVAHWGGGEPSTITIGEKGFSGPVRLIGLLTADPARASNSVTAVMLPDGHDADALRRIALERFNLSLGGGLASLSGRVFRIGHLGDLNEPMLLGALATVELALKVAGVPHRQGGANAAIDALT